MFALRGTFSWVLRRSLAGFATGMAGWCVSSAASRAAATSLSQTQHLLMTGVIGGIFLGSVEGMMEESTLKTVRGALAGAVGGVLGGGAAAAILARSTSPSAGMTAIIVTWAIVGMAAGLLSAWMEKRPARLLAGFLAGALGGAFGGWLGYNMYFSLSDIIKSDFWLVKRIIEGAAGAILGAVLWCVLGLAERFIIFKRRPAKDKDRKSCDRCHKHSPLNAWFCGDCGAVLQEAASAERLAPPRYLALARLISAFQFFGRLASTTSAVVALLAAIFLGTSNVFLGLFGLLVAFLTGYVLYILSNAFADWLTASQQ
jgi:hypothetical protein